MSDGVKGIYWERQVGMKSKHDDVDDVEWDDALPAGTYHPSVSLLYTFKKKILIVYELSNI